MFVSGNPEFVINIWGGGVNKTRTAVLMFECKRARDAMIRHVLWRLVHHHRVRVLKTAESWVELGVDFGVLAMEAILSCGVPITLSTVWDSAYKLKAIYFDT